MQSYGHDSKANLLKSNASATDDDEEEVYYKKDGYQSASATDEFPIRGPVKIECRQSFTDCSNVFKAFIGSAVIGLPFAVSQAGIGLTIIGIAIIGVITDHCCNKIVKCKQMVIANIQQERQTQGVDAQSIAEESKTLGRTLSFGQIGKACLGKPGVLIVNTSIMVTQFGFTIGYFIFMGNTLRSLLKYWLVPDAIPFHNTTLPTNSTLQTTFSPNFTTTMIPITTLPNVSTPSNLTKFYPTVDLGVVNSTTILNFLHHHITNLHHVVTTAVKDPWSPSNLIKNSTVTFGVLILFPLPLLIGIAFVRNLRKLGPISVIANISVTGGAAATVIYMFAKMPDLRASDLHWFKFSTFPVFFGQVTSAFEGIGTVIPIEGSMAENRSKYPAFLHISLVFLCFILSGFGITGYLRFGEKTCQIVTQNLRGDMAIILQIFLFIGVLLTYPLQIYPNIQIVEHLFVKFRRWRIGRQRRYEVMRRAAENESLLDSTEDKPIEVKNVKLKKWEGNIIRAVLVAFTAACALAFRSQFAYIAALTGSIGSSLLSYILPCMFDLALRKRKMSTGAKIVNIFLIVFGVVLGLMGMVVTLMEIAESFEKGHQVHC
eukprot:TCONS_00003874-protein